MSEQGLDRIVRHVRMAASYVQTAQDMAGGLLHNHTVANNLRRLKAEIEDEVTRLDVEYRESHFGRRR